MFRAAVRRSGAAAQRRGGSSAQWRVPTLRRAVHSSGGGGGGGGGGGPLRHVGALAAAGAAAGVAATLWAASEARARDINDDEQLPNSAETEAEIAFREVSRLAALEDRGELPRKPRDGPTGLERFNLRKRFDTFRFAREGDPHFQALSGFAQLRNFVEVELLGMRDKFVQASGIGSAVPEDIGALLNPLTDDVRTIVVDIDVLLDCWHGGPMGLTYLKRQGTDLFLDRLSRYYEIVLTGDVPLKKLCEMQCRLDPFLRIDAMIGREALVSKDGMNLKPLDRLGRNLDSVILLDTKVSVADEMRDNLVLMKPWFKNYGMQRNSIDLLNLIPFFEFYVPLQPAKTDVRDVVRRFREERRYIPHEFGPSWIELGSRWKDAQTKKAREAIYGEWTGYLDIGDQEQLQEIQVRQAELEMYAKKTIQKKYDLDEREAHPKRWNRNEWMNWAEDYRNQQWQDIQKAVASGEADRRIAAKRQQERFKNPYDFPLARSFGDKDWRPYTNPKKPESVDEDLAYQVAALFDFKEPTTKDVEEFELVNELRDENGELLDFSSQARSPEGKPKNRTKSL